MLALGALLIALDANTQNDLVQVILDIADKVDLGVFSRQNGVFDFTGENAEDKNALTNWGLAAIMWLLLGKVV